jgi:hypothetical protein
MRTPGSVCLPLVCLAVSSWAATTSSAPAKLAALKAEVEECHKKAVEVYMRGKWDALPAALKAAERQPTLLTPQQRLDLAYMRRTAAEFRPTWWNSCKSSVKVSFQARIWDRPITANFVPADKPGWSANADTHRKTITVTISWQPGMVDDTKEVEGELAKRHGLASGDIGELLVWLHLGYNYMLNALPLDQVTLLFTDHKLLFDHVQDFYALLTCVYHCSPRARLATFMLELGPLGIKSDRESQVRAACAMGSIFISEVLADPSKWPSVHLPPTVPDKNVEQATIAYVLENLDAGWSLAEDRAFRELIHNFMTAKGEQVLRGRGEVVLPSKLTLKLVATDDRDLQKKRDAWVAERLTKAGERKPDKKNSP